MSAGDTVTGRRSGQSIAFAATNTYLGPRLMVLVSILSTFGRALSIIIKKLAGGCISLRTGISGQVCSMARAATSAAAAANAFLEFGRQEPGFPPIDQMKLQKLLFYAHAWHLAQKDCPLFEEDFEAWPWGPVVRNIYNQTRKCGYGPVTDPLQGVEVAYGSMLDSKFFTPAVDDQETKEFLKAVWDTHKGYSGVQLSNATHASGEPWERMLKLYGSLDGKPTIPNDLIQSVFKAKIARVAASNTAA